MSAIYNVTIFNNSDQAIIAYEDEENRRLLLPQWETEFDDPIIVLIEQPSAEDWKKFSHALAHEVDK